MPGLCGIVGPSASSADVLASDLAVSGREIDWASDDDLLSVRVLQHPAVADPLPAESDGGARVWLWGEIYGSVEGDEYRPLTGERDSAAAVCARRYEEAGPTFPASLNGEFAGLVFDPDDSRVVLFTDRLGTRPLYYAVADDGCLLFTTHVQALANYPEIELDFDRSYLYEFLSLQKAFGVKTPLRGVQQLPPGSVATYEPGSDEVASRTYWRPVHDPVDRPFSHFVDRFTETFVRVIDERTRRDLDYGVLLSGGSDSRLILAALDALDREVTTYHVTNWRSRETRTAERVASEVSAEFRLLFRGDDYHRRLLSRTPAFSNFVGAFDEAFVNGFPPGTFEDVDVLLTGYLGDSMFEGYAVPTREVSVLGRTIPTPLHRSLEDVTDYIDFYVNREAYSATVPQYLETPPTFGEILRENVVESADGVVHHGVRYPSLDQLPLFHHYPVTNQYASLNSWGLLQRGHHWSPFFDRRLLDLACRMPLRHQRRRITHAAVKRLNPDLAAIPHAQTRAPLDEGGVLTGLREAVGRAIARRSDPDPPKSYLTHRSWMDEAELLRHDDFLWEALLDRRETIHDLPGVRWSAVAECHDDHLAGADHWQDLYMLGTLAHMPILERMGYGE